MLKYIHAYRWNERQYFCHISVFSKGKKLEICLFDAIVHSDICDWLFHDVNATLEFVFIPLILRSCDVNVRIRDQKCETVSLIHTIIIVEEVLDRVLVRLQVIDSQYLDSLFKCPENEFIGSHDSLD